MADTIRAQAVQAILARIRTIPEFEFDSHSHGRVDRRTAESAWGLNFRIASTSSEPYQHPFAQETVVVQIVYAYRATQGDDAWLQLDRMMGTAEKVVLAGGEQLGGLAHSVRFNGTTHPEEDDDDSAYYALQTITIVVPRLVSDPFAQSSS